MSRLGDVLKSIRTEKGISLSEIAQQTNISRKWLEALEKDEFSKIPGKFHFRNFLKGYLQAVHYDEDEFFLEHQPVIDSIGFKEYKKELYYSNLKFSRFRRKRMIIGILVLIVVISILTFLLFTRKISFSVENLFHVNKRSNTYIIK